MKHTELLHSILEKSGAIQHKGRLKSVMAAVSSVMNGASLSLTSMGRHLGYNDPNYSDHQNLKI